MKEYYTPYDLKGVGLRVDHRSSHNSPGLVECINAKPSPYGIVGIEDITNPLADSMTIEGIEIDWPYPQMFIGISQSLLLTRSEIYSIDTDWNLTLKVSVPVGSQNSLGWSIADFDDYILITNGDFAVASLNGDFTVDLPDYMTSIPYSVTSYRGRLVTGGPGNIVSWSKIGSVDLTPSRSNEAGFRPMPWKGSVLVVKELGDHVVVYGSGGITALKAISSPAPTLAMLEIENNFGIAGRGAVAGDRRVHYYIDEKGYAWSLSADLTRKRLGYKEFFSLMLEGTIIGSYDSQEEDAYFSSGDYSYVLNPSGLGSTNQHVTSLSNVDGELVGIFTLGNNFEFKITTDIMSFKTRSIKNIQVIEIEGEMPYETYCSIQWRNTKNGNFRESVLKRLNNEGVVYPQVSGTDVRIVVSSNYWDGMEFGSLGIRWKNVDKRSIRGMGNAN